MITENGICTNDDAFREKALKEYMVLIHGMLRDGIDIRGYFYWSTWDNFEWTLGSSYRFGLYACDPITMNRTRKKTADTYSKLAYSGEIMI